jgi:hypothetical protein
MVKNARLRGGMGLGAFGGSSPLCCSVIGSSAWISSRITMPSSGIEFIHELRIRLLVFISIGRLTFSSLQIECLGHFSVSEALRIFSCAFHCPRPLSTVLHHGEHMDGGSARHCSGPASVSGNRALALSTQTNRVSPICR